MRASEQTKRSCVAWAAMPAPAYGALPTSQLVDRQVRGPASSATGMTARLAVIQDGYPVGVERVDGPGNVRFHAPRGQREPPHATAAGKAMLAMLDRERVLEISRETGLARYTEHTITDQDRLSHRLAPSFASLIVSLTIEARDCRAIPVPTALQRVRLVTGQPTRSS
jgi:DNA-binding IclR family transcriptional regulator